MLCRERGGYAEARARKTLAVPSVQRFMPGAASGVLLQENLHQAYITSTNVHTSWRFLDSLVCNVCNVHACFFTKIPPVLDAEYTQVRFQCR